MVDTITIPGTNKTVPKWLAYAGLAVIVLILVLITRRKQSAAPADEYYMDPSNITPGTVESINESQTPGITELTTPINEGQFPYSVDPIVYPETSGIFNTPIVDPSIYGSPTVPVSGSMLENVAGYTIPLHSAQQAQADIDATSKTMEKPTTGFSRDAQVVLTQIKTTLQKKSGSVPSTSSSTVQKIAPTINRAPAQPSRPVKSTPQTTQTVNRAPASASRTKASPTKTTSKPATTSRPSKRR